MSVSDTGQKDQYWEQFALLPLDIEHLVNFLVETERPYTLRELAREIVRYRHQQAMSLMKDILSQGRIYRPAEAYQVGEFVIFPHLGNVLGEVIEVRPGCNPEFEPFSVMRLRLDTGSEREYAAELPGEHPLNTATYFTAADVTVDELFDLYGEKVEDELQATLETSSQFISVAHKWFVRDLVMEVPPGQLNIAEALLDMSGGGPVPTSGFLEVMDLPAEIPDPLKLFSLEYALLRDNRFDEVGPAGQALWYLRRMEPQQVLETPELLRYMPIPHNRSLLDEVMLTLELQADDEWSDTEYRESEDNLVTVVLSYPHWRSGTLPLAPHIAGLFPTAQLTDRIRFTFIDGDTKETFPGWVVLRSRYVYGLAAWYKRQQVQVGAYIDLQHGEEPGSIIIQARSIRSRRREWLRTASVEDGRLYLEVTRVPVFCEFDELAAVAVPNPDNVDALAVQLKRASLELLLDQVFNGLAGLSLQRAVHAMTLYSVLNLVRRVPPAPMLSVLATSSKYVSLGDNYWAYRGDD
ncbi:MAG: hypothetical protein JXA33_06630 [Anaerolineae bacterium]|nr:hypothetical protein [Anaerolineae bacterium]